MAPPKQIQCTGCGKLLNNGRGYANHKRTCRQQQAEAAVRLDLYRQNMEKRAHAAEEAHRAWIREQAESSYGEHGDASGIGEDTTMVEPIEIEPELPVTRASGLPARRTRLPARYQDAAAAPRPRRRARHPANVEDELPADPPPLISIPESSTTLTGAMPPTSQQSSSGSSSPDVSFRTLPDRFGVYRVYPGGKPLYSPDEAYALSDVVDSANMVTESSTTSRSWFVPHPPPESFEDALQHTSHAPFPNITTYRLMSWYYSSSNVKSQGQLDQLVNEVLRAPDFSQDELLDFRAAKEMKRMDSFNNNSPISKSQQTLNNRWIETSVSISLPCDGVKHASEADAPKFEVKGLFYRRITEVIKSALAEPAAEKFHLFPFEAYWKPSANAPGERIYSEAYSADYFLDEYEKIRLQPRPADKAHLTPVILGLKIWSDSTHLANFGTASLWPIYIYFGNLSKYVCAKPSSFAAHHLAYIPKLGDDIQEAYKSFFDKLATEAILRHLRRDLVQTVWLLMMDDEFMHMYLHGLELDRYLFFPRFPTHGADYPEKMLMACLKFLAQCLCPRCLILKSKSPRLGMKSDRQDRVKLERVDNEMLHHDIDLVRKWLFVDGTSLTSVAVDRILKSKSLVPTRNAFSLRLFEHGFNYYQMYVPDLMHEFELGVWKALFTHLMRILHAYGNETVSTLNSRYRNVPPFGHATIRRFHNNASAMKKLAARDFEDLLQCAIPVFEGLLPREHDKILRLVLFEASTWHGLAKLRLHTETTLNELENSTIRLGECMRKFERDLCPEYNTKDLPSEQAARTRRRARKAAKSSTQLPAALSSTRNTTNDANKQHKFNLDTYKYHALGDYVRTIRLHGTTDGYSTQLGELEHRRAKCLYPCVRKGMHTKGIAKEVLRERLLHLITSRSAGRHKVAIMKQRRGRKQISEVLPLTSPTLHHHISAETREKVDIAEYCDAHEGDPALEDFLPRLLDHLLARLLNLEYDGDEHEFTDEERANVIIVNDRMYRHHVARVNYTTYDNRRAQDTINPRTRPDIMMLSSEDGEDGHPYWYARVLEIFHASVLHVGPQSKSSQPQRMEFMLVRWFGRDTNKPGGWKARRLHRIGFVSAGSTPFGFVDPAIIIRAVHLIPAFAHLETPDLLGQSKVARPWAANIEEHVDWRYYYVNMFVDRDMMMRFRGGGVGHKSTRTATDAFKKDRDQRDLQHDEPNDSESDAMSDVVEEQNVMAQDDRDDDREQVPDAEGNDDECEDYGYHEPGGEDENSDEDEGEQEDEGAVDSEEVDGEQDEVEELGFADL